MTARPLALAALLALAAWTLAIACTGGDQATEAGAPASPSPPAAGTPGGDATAAPRPDTPIAATPTPPAGDPAAPVTTTPLPNAGTGTPAPTPAAPDADPPLPPGLVEEPARIVSAELAIAESFPPQYFVSIVSAQPDGCTRFSRFEVERSGTLIEITVLNTVPERRAVVLCAAIYGETTSNVALGSDFDPGETYTLSVNGAEQRFVAQ